MVKNIKMWFIRNFKIITTEQAKLMGLKFHFNIYGDAINFYNCRSIWRDNNGKYYRVKELHEDDYGFVKNMEALKSSNYI